ncbi:MAG: formate C-acetyltransferase [Chloroflexi bacterium]|nr:formate C-acetyltransferase [Chloroflexota bacterium]
MNQAIQSSLANIANQAALPTAQDIIGTSKNRIQRLRERLFVDKYPVCIEKIRLLTESYKQTAGEPQIIRRAKALANVLDKITIFIEPDELIVGNAASKPMAVEFDCDYGIWSQDEIDALKQDGFTTFEADEIELKAINEYWKGKTLVGRMGQFYDDERLWPFMQSGVVLPPWKTREEGSGGGYAQGGLGLGPGFLLCGFDFAKVLNGGLNQIIADAETELTQIRFTNADAVKKVDYLKAVIIAHRAIIRFANQFAILAITLAAKESDPTRRQELTQIAEICSWVPAHPARNFREAMQSFWFMFLMLTPSTTAAAGRFDQYMLPFYQRDIATGRIDDEQVLELLQCLRIKDMQINRTSGKANRQKNAGLAKWHNWTIGGVTPEGHDATNELSYLILEAAKRCPTPHHTITVRVHDGTPEKLMRKSLEVVRTGIGMPAFVSDKSYIEFLLTQGVPLRTARDYIMTGCLDVNIVGQSRIASYGMFIAPLALDIFLRNGIDPNTGQQVGLQTGELENFSGFDELFSAFKKQFVYLMSVATERNNIELRVMSELFPDPVRSSLMVDGITAGKDMLDRRMPLENGGVLNPIGLINVADSLTAIKWLVFDEKKITLKELKAALLANWQGQPYEAIRKQCLAAPKYGNDDDYADAMAHAIYQFWADTTVTFDTALGGKHIPTAISITSHAPGGALTSATPDGRYAGECLADGTTSPMRGRDTNGPTSVIKSASKIDQAPYQATLMNMKFHPSAVKTTEDLRKLSSLIRTYFGLGGKHLQFNVVTKETLLAAQKQPENYRDLVVRMAGYSAYFVQLGKTVQDEIIARTEHQHV